MKIFIVVIIVASAWISIFSESLLNVKEHILNNGLKVLIVEDHKSPLTVCRLYYKVGSVYENIGKSGLSHMLEHMMFKGTETIGVTDFSKEQKNVTKIDSLFRLSDNAYSRGDSTGFQKYKSEAMKYVDDSRKYIKNNELWGLYQKEGGTALNAWTGDNMTAYIVTLPSNKVELFMWLESDRMAHPVMREFYTERDVVMEERRLRYENSPYGRFYESLSSMLFEAHPYRIPTIGYMSDLHHLTRADAFNHFKKFYAPNNAVLILVGDIKEADVLQMVRKYFGNIQKGPEIEPLFTTDPEPIGQKRLIVKKNVAPILEIFFKVPALGKKDVFPLNIIEGVLNGKSGRLYKTLVRDKKFATDVSAGNIVQNYTSFFMVHADLVEGVSPDKVEAEIWNELNKLSTDLISVRELEKVKNNVTAEQINLMRSNEGLADRLAFYEIGGDWKWINSYLTDMNEVTREEVRDVAKQYFTEKNSIIGIVEKDKKGGKK